MLYTSYISKLNELPKDMVKILVTRFPPKWLDATKYEKLYLRKQLSPKQDILLDYKKDNDWLKYKLRFEEQMYKNEETAHMINKIVDYIKQENDVCLVCYEKDNTKCHRQLLANKIGYYGVGIEEFDKGKYMKRKSQEDLPNFCKIRGRIYIEPNIDII